MYKKDHFYCVAPDWLSDMAKELQTEVINNNTLLLPEAVGSGYSFYIQVIPGIAVMLSDFVLKTPLEIRRINDDVSRVVFHYDISDHENQIITKNTRHKIGHNAKLGLSIFDLRKDKTSFEPTVGRRTYAISLFIDKKLLFELVENDSKKESINQRINFFKKKLFYTVDIDGDSLLLLTSLKDMPISTTSFDTNLRGLSLKLLSNTFIKFSEFKTDLATTDIDGLNKSKEYLSNHLHNPFPSISFLSRIAGMSTTKFKVLFKKYFQNTPKNLFIREKMTEANKLLQSGDFSAMSDIIKELNYYEVNYFSKKYFSVFNRNPMEDFVKKDTSKYDDQ